MTIEETIKNMPRRKTSGEHFYEKNFNPFALIDIDCSIRAVPAAIMMKYVDVCRHLGMGFKDGMAQGVETMDLSRLQASSLAKYFEKMKFINANGWRYSKSDAAGLDVMPAADVRVNVNDFCEAAGKVCPNEIFIVFCANNDGSYVDDIAYSQSDAGHVVAVYAQRSHPYFVDTWDCGDMLVTGYMRVKKQVPKNSPERLNIREFNLSQREKVAEAKRLERQFGRSLQDTASDRSRQAAMRLKSTADLVGRYAERFEPSGGIPVAKALRKLECEMRSVCSWLGFVGEIYLNDEDHQLTVFVTDGAHLDDAQTQTFFDAVCKACARCRISSDGLSMKYVSARNPKYIRVEPSDVA